MTFKPGDIVKILEPVWGYGPKEYGQVHNHDWYNDSIWVGLIPIDDRAWRYKESQIKLVNTPGEVEKFNHWKITQDVLKI